MLFDKFKAACQLAEPVSDKKDQSSLVVPEELVPEYRDIEEQVILKAVSGQDEINNTHVAL